jgi:all-trans-8'-apo-beta-carotenal 15,15'-oxygenase
MFRPTDRKEWGTAQMADATLAQEGLSDDVAYPIDEVEGEIPSALVGTLLRNGPGLTTSGRDQLAMLDAHGAVAGVSFEGGRALFRSRLVQTEILLAERAAGRMLKRRAFTNLPSRWKNLFNIDFRDSCNHDAFAFDGKVYGSDTFGWYALDGRTLETLGAERLGGVVKGDLQTSPMPRIDPRTGRLICYTLQPGKISPDVLTFRELGRGLKLEHTVAWRMPGKGNLVHDLSFSEHYYVVIRFGQLSPPRVLGGGAPLWGCVDFDGERTPRLFAIPRDGALERVVDVPLDNQLAFHIFNAFERDGKLFVDTTSLPSRIDFSATYPAALLERYALRVRETPPARIQRHVIDLASGKIESKVVSDVIGEAPEIDERRHGSPHRFGYVAARTEPADETDPNAYFFFHGIAKIDFETGQSWSWSAGARAFCSPPAFVPLSGDAAEDEGWLLTWILDCAAGRTDVAILDARDLAAGPIARLHLRHRLGSVSHTRFESAIRLLA